jgi:integrase
MVVHMALAMARPWKHPKTGIYWLRKRVPNDLRALLGKREEKASLGTREPDEAKLLHVQALAELEQRWANLRAPPKPISEREAHELVAPAYEWWINLHRDNPSEQTVWKTKFFDKLWTWPSKYVPLAEEILHWEEDGYFDRIAMEKFCRERVQELLASGGLRTDELSRPKIEKAFGAAIQRASTDLAKLAKGEVAKSLHSQPAISVAQHTPDTVAVGEHVTFESLIAGWASERRPMQKTIYEYKRVLGNLTDFLGHDDATRLSPKDLVAWKGKMIEAGLHPKTILGAKLAPVRAILQWGVDNDHLPSNPAARITIGLKTRAADSKRGFNDDEAATILTAANAAADPVKRWVPLLGAYSGARLSEICQLRVQDVAEVNGIWCMKILPEAGSLKTLSSERVVPLHPAVIEAGFLQFVSKLPPGALFQALRPDKFGKRGGTGTKVIGRWVRGLGLTDKRLSPSHSWRHRFKTMSRRHEVMADIANAITGHHRKTVADSYGEFPIEALYRELCKIPKITIG